MKIGSFSLTAILMALASRSCSANVCLIRRFDNGAISDTSTIGVSSSTESVTCKITCSGATALDFTMTAGNRLESMDNVDCPTAPDLTLTVNPDAENGVYPPRVVVTAQSVTDFSYECECSGGGVACFSPSTTVHVQGEGEVALKDLKIGSKVLTDAATQKFETVYAMSHYDANIPTDYVQLYFDKSKKNPLEVTEDHLMYLQGQARPVRAGSLAVGDIMEGGHQLTSVGKSRGKGRMSPLTGSGKVIVNGQTQASTYVDYEQATKLVGPDSVNFWLHIGVSPFRLFCTHADPNSDYCVSYSEDGIPLGLNFWKGMYDDAMNQSNLVIKGLYLALCFSIAFVAWGLECLLMAPVAASLAALVLGAKMAGVQFKVGGEKKKVA